MYSHFPEDNFEFSKLTLVPIGYKHLLLLQLLIVTYFCSSHSSLCPCDVHFVQLRQLVYVTACA
jgi:hypothetical protein